MINLLIKKNNNQDVHLIYDFYNDINRIPLEIILDTNSVYKQGIDIDNYDEQGGSFITFKFDKETNVLCSITFTSINEKNIIYEEFLENINNAEGSYQFYIINNQLRTRTKDKVSLILDSNNDILISFDDADCKKLNFYGIDENLFLGVDLNNNLKSILLKGLKEEDIKQFLNL
ncbi:hypothetical protein M2347_002575 [Chryseobacterium sp. H1D6B]|uniref:hypothetical protein n=1 Tax=Chryseobacterium sp. H1D6B TaxID=2940588 RepID=UPI0015CE644E|nr:hypothetical protein [Chryseobacterium sp. H1D6B]MDH6252848.1 hypothetical protein [Chryseobacterium sp. H1D6B]